VRAAADPGQQLIIAGLKPYSGPAARAAGSAVSTRLLAAAAATQGASRRAPGDTAAPSSKRGNDVSHSRRMLEVSKQGKDW
jgi:hypothetical protein